jgi:hypothetical protein
VRVVHDAKAGLFWITFTKIEAKKLKGFSRYSPLPPALVNPRSTFLVLSMAKTPVNNFFKNLFV